MQPALKENQSVLVSVLPYLFTSPKTSDIIAFRKPGSKTILIKRIKRVKRRQYFAQGDNLDDSMDSRKFGMIEKENIIGKVIYILK